MSPATRLASSDTRNPVSESRSSDRVVTEHCAFHEVGRNTGGAARDQRFWLVRAPAGTIRGGGFA